MNRDAEAAYRAAWAEDAWEIMGDDFMRPQPDMAQMPLEYEPMTWRDHARTAVELMAAIVGGFGLFAACVAARMIWGG